MAGRADFYVLADETPDARLRCACRLAERAVEDGQYVYLKTAARGDTLRLDELLWTFNDRSFLVHELYSGSAASHARVMVLVGEDAAPASHRNLLINLSEVMPPELDLYQRVAEIVDADAGRKQRARERYRQYREQGWTLESHNL